MVREAKLGWIALIYFTSACRVQHAKSHPSTLACTLSNSKDNGVWNEQIRSENLSKYKKFRLPLRPAYIIWINSSILIRLVYTVNQQRRSRNEKTPWWEIENWNLFLLIGLLSISFKIFKRISWLKECLSYY